MLPVDADAHVLQYNPNFLNAMNLSEPKTLEDVLMAAERFHAMDEPFDPGCYNQTTGIRLPDNTPGCKPHNWGWCMYWWQWRFVDQLGWFTMNHVLPHMISKTAEQGHLFDPVTFEPLVDTEGWAWNFCNPLNLHQT